MVLLVGVVDDIVLGVVAMGEVTVGRVAEVVLVVVPVGVLCLLILALSPISKLIVSGALSLRLAIPPASLFCKSALRWASVNSPSSVCTGEVGSGGGLEGVV